MIRKYSRVPLSQSYKVRVDRSHNFEVNVFKSLKHLCVTLRNVTIEHFFLQLSTLFWELYHNGIDIFVFWVLSHRIITTETSSVVTKMEISNMRINCRILEMCTLDIIKFTYKLFAKILFKTNQIKSLLLSHHMCLGD